MTETLKHTNSHFPFRTEQRVQSISNILTDLLYTWNSIWVLLSLQYIWVHILFKCLQPIQIVQQILCNNIRNIHYSSSFRSMYVLINSTTVSASSLLSTCFTFVLYEKKNYPGSITRLVLLIDRTIYCFLFFLFSFFLVSLVFYLLLDGYILIPENKNTHIILYRKHNVSLVPTLYMRGA